MEISARARAPVRRQYIDVARGIAVLLMIEAHTVDEWTRLDVRHTTAFRNATVLGGFAAPLFLWLAGVGAALAAARTAGRHGRRAALEAVCRRGLEIFILAFLFRLQALLLTPGGALLSLFRVDILNVMGPAIVAAGLLWAAARTDRGRVALFSTATLIVAMMTPIVRATGAVARLPMWLQWYVRPFADMTTFTMFPWAAFVFAGGAVGVVVAATAGERAEHGKHAALAVAGGALIAVGFWTASRPSLYPASSFWTSSPTWFAIRVGIVMTAFAALYGIDILAGRRSNPIARMGRASLFIYWIHVELVYGYASWLWHHSLPLWAAAAACVAFCVVMYEAIGLRDWLTTYRRTRANTAATATA